MENGDVSPAGGGVRKGPHVVAEIVVDGQRVELGVVPGGAQQVADPPRAVADGIPAMRRGDPLVDDHAPDVLARSSPGSARYSAGRYCRSSSSRSNWSNCAQKSKATAGAGRGGRSRSWRTYRSSVPAKSRPRRR